MSFVWVVDKSYDICIHLVMATSYRHIKYSLYIHQIHIYILHISIHFISMMGIMILFLLIRPFAFAHPSRLSTSRLR